MRVAIPHELDKEEVRRRLRDHSHEIGDAIPGGVANVATGWPSDDRMTLNVGAMGQTVTGHIDVESNQVVLELSLPPMLSFIEPIVAAAVRDQGQKMLAPPKD